MSVQYSTVHTCLFFVEKEKNYLSHTDSRSSVSVIHPKTVWSCFVVVVVVTVVGLDIFAKNATRHTHTQHTHNTHKRQS